MDQILNEVFTLETQEGWMLDPEEKEPFLQGRSRAVNSRPSHGGAASGWSAPRCSQLVAATETGSPAQSALNTPS